MNFENEQTHENPLDKRWYKRLENLTLDDYEKLTDDKTTRSIERGKFLSNPENNPTLNYPELTKMNLEEREHEFGELKNEVLGNEQNEIIRKVYRTKINEVLATVRMLKAARDGNDKKFGRYSNFIYGRPSGDHLSYVLNSVSEFIDKFNESTDQDEREAAHRLRSLLIRTQKETQSDTHYADKSILPKGIEISDFVESSDDVIEAFKNALSDLELTDWSVVQDTDRGIKSFSVSQENKTVHIPSDEVIQKRNISKRKLQGLIAHEIGTHALRRKNGERSKLMLLGLGLDRYLKGEEGIATYNEQLVTGAKEFAGIPRYVSIAIASGVDGVKRDFKDTFAVMRDYRFLGLKPSPDRLTKASEKAYDDCVRIFRGTTCSSPGMVFTKDLAYIGNREIWTLVSNDSEITNTFTIGKFDPSNDEHITVLTQLGILDSDLDNLEDASIEK